MSRTLSYIKSSPALRHYYVAFLTFINLWLVSIVNNFMLQLIFLKGLDPNPAPPPPPPKPSLEVELAKEPLFSQHSKVHVWFNSWYDDSVRNPSKHVILQSRKKFEEKEPKWTRGYVAPVVTQEIGGDAIDSLKDALQVIKGAVINQPAEEAVNITCSVEEAKPFEGSLTSSEQVEIMPVTSHNEVLLGEKK